MNIFRTLAETIYEKNFFSFEEIEDIIETYFKIYLSDIKSTGLIKDSIASEKMRITSERSQLSIKRTIIEKQIFDAKAKIAEGRGSEVDRYWFSRANMAFRLTKQSIVECQDRLSVLATIEKNRNVENTMQEDRVIRVAMYKKIEERYGTEYAKQLYNEVLTAAKIEF